MLRSFFHLATISVLLAACGSSTPTNEANGTPVDSVAQAPTEPKEFSLPARVSANWQLLAPDRWDTYWQQQYADSTGDLGHRTADLDGDGTVDHALFLSRKDTTRRDSAYALVVCFGNNTDTTLAVESWAEADGHIGMGLDLEPPGPLGHLGGEEGGEPEGTVDLKQPAVTLIYFEKASITWYWKDGSFHQVWTGD